MKRYMLKNVIKSVLVATAVLFTACDKIDSDDYLIYSGSNGEWVNGSSVTDKEQRVFVEKYTGVRCVNCPDADVAISQIQSSLGHKVIAVSIHAGGMARPYSGYEDFRTETGEAWNTYFGIQANPSVLVNRSMNNGTPNIITDVAAVSGAVNSALSQNGNIAMEMSSTFNADNGNGYVDVSLEFLEKVADELTITLLVTEDGIIGKQLEHGGTNENYEFNHVFRMTITDLWGADVVADGEKGTCRIARFEYSLPSNYKAEKCHIVGFISKKNTREIIQSAETSLM